MRAPGGTGLLEFGAAAPRLAGDASRVAASAATRRRRSKAAATVVGAMLRRGALACAMWCGALPLWPRYATTLGLSISLSPTTAHVHAQAGTTQHTARRQEQRHRVEQHGTNTHGGACHPVVAGSSSVASRHLGSAPSSTLTPSALRPSAMPSARGCWLVAAPRLCLWPFDPLANLRPGHPSPPIPARGRSAARHTAPVASRGRFKARPSALHLLPACVVPEPRARQPGCDIPQVLPQPPNPCGPTCSARAHQP